MKRNIVILILLVLLSVNAIAMDKLVTIPVAGMVGGEGFVAGEIRGSYRQVEGLYNLNSSTAVGAVISQVDGRDAKLGLLAKAMLAVESQDSPVITAGIRKKDLYFVASKELGMGFRGHVGFGNGGFGGLFLGFNKVLNPVSISQEEKASLPIMNLMGEYVNEEVNLGLRMNLQDNMKLDLGLLDFESFKIGLGYAF